MAWMIVTDALAVSCHFIAMTTNPGAVPAEFDPLEQTDGPSTPFKLDVTAIKEAARRSASLLSSLSSSSPSLLS